MKTAESVVITTYARTPIGSFRGELSDLPSPQLGATAIEALLSRSRVPAGEISEVLMGCVLSAGLRQGPARQAALAAGLPDTIPCTTVNKLCGSGMKAVMLAHDLIVAESANVVIAGGMESMSNAPYMLDRARSSYRLGHGQLIDHMFFDGLEDAYEKGRLMGSIAEAAAQDHQITREAQDEFALCSLERAKAAIEDGCFDKEITPVNCGKGETINRDEQPFKAKPEKIRSLKPVFRPDGTITAANASSISDGAAALMLMPEAKAAAMGARPLARICGHATHAQAPAEFPIAPVGAIRKVLDKVGWRADDVDLYEINEAFAVVVMIVRQALGLSDEKVNVHGGACALGHPIGASGARILVTLLAALETYSLRRGVASLCIGGGEATAIAVERL
ncbi:MAG: acetyl-CoA C-acyltransferase [Alphaproteobacteria bacterium]|nr:acetyl-CoA C-acyltransferase [Alphaproteobacteria bacterium]MDE2496144.1 acetyl-CoA C-acyltransferase [Alphaproteobacteria bacterium]